MAYREDRDATRAHIEVLEAQLAESRAALVAKEAALHARDVELGELRRRLERQPPPSRAAARHHSFRVGALMLACLGFSFSIAHGEAERMTRTKAELQRARVLWEQERYDMDFAIALLRAEASHLKNLVATRGDDDWSAPGGLEGRKQQLLRWVAEGTATPEEHDLLVSLCERTEDTACLAKLVAQ
ncbi:MAG: hypothetical protein AAGA56_15830 [Myxococcota bacterium]